MNPFGPSTSSPTPASPFNSSMQRKPFGEPAGLSPEMQPIAIDETPWYKKITLAQVVRA